MLNIFFRCSGLTSITIPNSVTSIGVCVFERCSGLASITIPNSVTSIDRYAFEGCSGLTSITIPNSVTSIGNEAFNGCSGLTSITIPNSVTSISVRVFAHCSGLTSITIPNSVTSIGEGAFEGCSGLTSITIPNSVTSIGERIFYDCCSLTSIIIPHGINSIGRYAFVYCSGLTSITIPNSVTSIGYGAFIGCSGLTSITIPNSVTSIGEGAFENCIGLTSITIPNSVTSIGERTFYDCSGLTSITIGNSVSRIGNEAFAKCKEMADVYCYPPIVPNNTGWYSNNFEDLFNESYIEYATLHVPESAMEDYKATAPWSRFKKIVPLPNYKLTYLVDGEVYNSYKLEEERKVPKESEPYKEGYTFSGWSKIPETMPACDVEVTGSFTINNYNLIYVVDGEVYKTVEVEYGSAITPEADPEKEGYAFRGWNGVPETMPAYDVWVYGYFDELSLGKCATPIISYSYGELKFYSETEDATCIYTISDNDIKTGSGNEVLLDVTYQISVYATKPGYDNSDVAIATLCWIEVEPWTEGITNSVSNVRARPVLIQTNGNSLSISGVDKGTPINIFDTSGKIVGSATAALENTNISTSLRPGDIGLVKIGEKTIKIIMK